MRFSRLVKALVVATCVGGGGTVVDAQTPPQPLAAPQAEVGVAYSASARGIGVDVFYDSLAPYGTWYRDPRFGIVWQPAVEVVGPNFRPYATGGQWVYTDYGWAFASDYDWGWAPFHYGRWYYDPGADWIWIPGDTWGPAWVDWRFGDGYIGWAPLAPAGITIALDERPDFWFFCGAQSFLEPNVVAFAVPPQRVQVVLRETQPLRTVTTLPGRVRAPTGPSPQVVQQVTNRQVVRVAVQAPAPRQIAPVHVREVARAQGVRIDPVKPGPKVAHPTTPAREHLAPAAPPAQRRAPAAPPQQRAEPARPVEPAPQRAEPTRRTPPERAQPTKPTTTPERAQPQPPPSERFERQPVRGTEAPPREEPAPPRRPERTAPPPTERKPLAAPPREEAAPRPERAAPPPPRPERAAPPPKATPPKEEKRKPEDSR